MTDAEFQIIVREIMKIFVTGANGFLGSNLVRELIKRRHRVTGLVLKGLDPTTIANLDIEIVFGNILDYKQLEKQTKGFDAIIHTAANISMWPGRNKFQRKVNINGTRNIIKVVHKNRIKKYIHVGSANSFGFGTKENPGDEEKSYNMLQYGIDYIDSKYEAQKLVLDAVKENNLPAVIVNPCFMFGPYSTEGGAKMIQEIYCKRVPFYTLGGRNYICVKDVCIGIANALNKGKIGECYILGNKNMTYNDIFSLIGKITNVNPPKLIVPKLIAKLYAHYSIKSAAFAKRIPKLTPAMVDISYDSHFYSAQKAVKSLNLPQTPIDIGIKESFKWLKENNLLGD